MGALLIAMAAVVSLDARTIRLYKCGSSSFPDEILELTKEMIEAGSDDVLEFERAGYTRLDQFVDGRASYEDWLDRYMPAIESGNFDYVIFQTINWYYNSPSYHDEMFKVLIPDLAARVRATGSEIMFYDKYVGQTEGCYRDPPYTNPLWHIEACTRSNIDLISWTGPAVDAVDNSDVLTGNLPRMLYNGGHPGPVINYLTACNLSYVLAGIDPRTTTVRHVPLTGNQQDSYGSYSEVSGEYLNIPAAVADTLQAMALATHLEWMERLQANLDDQEFFYTVTMPEIEMFEAEFGIEALIGKTLTDNDKNRCDLANMPELSADELAAIRATLSNLSPRVHDKAESYLDAAGFAQLLDDYAAYWLDNNSKFRDDVYYQNLIDLKLAQNAGDNAEEARLSRMADAFLEILSLAAEDLLIERLSGPDEAEALATFAWPDSMISLAPQFASVQSSLLDDYPEFKMAREVYFEVWEDVNLEDELRDGGFLAETWLKADSIFTDHWQDYQGGTASVERRPVPTSQTAMARVAISSQGVLLTPTGNVSTVSATIISPHGRVLARLNGGQQFYAWPSGARSGLYVVDYCSGGERGRVSHVLVR